MDIQTFVKNFKSHPVLFVGAGLSRRYYTQAYSWEELLRKITEELYGSERANEKFIDIRRKTKSEGDLPQWDKFATLLSEKIDTELEKERTEEERTRESVLMNEVNKKYYEHNGNISRIKLCISELLSNLKINEEKREEIERLKIACRNISSIITTNYDTFIEDELRFDPLIGNDILCSNPYQSVYKIHGCIRKPQEIIITEEDYKKFTHKHELIRAQLVSLFIHNPIIFIGYRISDNNIKELLKTIFSYVPKDSDLSREIGSRFLRVEYNGESQNTEIDTTRLELEVNDEIVSITINTIQTDNFSALYEALSDLRLPVEAIHIRRVESVFQEIKRGGQIKVELVEGWDQVENRDRIIAIGSQQHISLVYDAQKAIKMYFKIIDGNLRELTLSGKIFRSQFFPAIGLSNAFIEMGDRDQLKKQQKQKIEEYIEKLNRNAHITRLRDTLPPGVTPLNTVLEGNSIPASSTDDVIAWIAWNDIISLDDLKSYLQRKLDNEGEGSIPTSIRRLLCIYDIKHNSPEGEDR